MINTNIIVFLVVGSLLVIIVSLLKILHQFIMEKRASKPLYPGGKTVTNSMRNYIPFIPLSIKRKLKASGIRPVPGKQQASANMNSVNSKANRLQQFMLMKGLYDCVKVIKKPTRKPVKDSDSGSNN